MIKIVTLDARLCVVTTSSARANRRLFHAMDALTEGDAVSGITSACSIPRFAFAGHDFDRTESRRRSSHSRRRHRIAKYELKDPVWIITSD